MPSILSELTAEQIKEYKEAGVLELIIQGEKNNPTATSFVRPVYAPRTNDPTSGGIFTQPGVRPEMESVLNQPMDITSILNPQPSLFAQERIGILTGQTVTTGTNPNDTCGDPVRPGVLKTCQQNYIFGEFFIGSQLIKISDAGMLANRAVTQRRILNEAAVNPFLPAILQGANVDFASVEAQQLYQIGTALRRAIAKVMINGNSATIPASAEAGFVKEFNGLDTIIKTGYVDVVTGVACPSADSTVVNFNANIYTGTDSLGRNIGQVITDTYFGLKTLDMQLGTNAQWTIVIAFPAFRELAYAYANQYYETRSVGTSGNNKMTLQADIRRLQLEQFNGRYLLIDGEAVPVIFSDGITISAGGGNQQQSDMFFVATQVNGRDGINFEYFPLDNPNASKLASRFSTQIQMLNNGMMMLYAERQKDCMELDIVGKCRMFLEAPFLCAKIQKLQYQSNIGYRSPFTNGTNYQNGGATGYTVNVF